MSDAEKLRHIGAWFGIRALLIGASIVLAKLAWLGALIALRFA